MLKLLVLFFFCGNALAMGEKPQKVVPAAPEIVTMQVAAAKVEIKAMPVPVKVEEPKVATTVKCKGVPPAAEQYKESLHQAIANKWPDYSSPWYFASQVEQETCISATHRKCWNPKTENINPKNNGEYGWGLGQLTNTNKYNNFEDLKKRDSDFKSWKWDDRFNPEYQLRAMIFMDLAGYKPFKEADDYNRSAFMFSAYNGGTGGVLADRKYCRQVPGCNPELWFGNVETNSLKAKTKLAGYSVSAFHINREYVHNIMIVRADKYRCWF